METPTAARIEDFGEKLGGARKDKVTASTATDADIRTKSLGELWPADEHLELDDTFLSALMFTARSLLPSRPRVKSRVDYWVKQFQQLREIVDGATPEMRSELIERARNNRLTRPIAEKVELLESLDRSQWKRIGEVEAYPNATRADAPAPFVTVVVDGKREYFEGARTALEVAEQIRKTLGASEAQPKAMQFEVRRNSRSGEVFINKKGDSKYRKLKTFDDSKAALAYIKTNHADLVAAWEGIKATDNVKESDVRGKENRARAGIARRNGDVTPETFAETFGFRGVEFGNWVAQGSGAKDRQGMLNEAFDALHDLAAILNIPTKAISLNGTMGLALGARGSGRAMAHFEPDKIVINLTKNKGAGSLAHEWFHALDNYFARKRGGEVPMSVAGGDKAYRESNFVTYRPEAMLARKDRPSVRYSRERLASLRKADPSNPFYSPENWIVDPKHKPGVRVEVEERFSELVKALNASPMSARSSRMDASPMRTGRRSSSAVLVRLKATSSPRRKSRASQTISSPT
jgi:hypothetical protein